jgi:hypothetical protein
MIGRISLLPLSISSAAGSYLATVLVGGLIRWAEVRKWNVVGIKSAMTTITINNRRNEDSGGSLQEVLA